MSCRARPAPCRRRRPAEAYTTGKSSCSLDAPSSMKAERLIHDLHAAPRTVHLADDHDRDFPQFERLSEHEASAACSPRTRPRAAARRPPSAICARLAAEVRVARRVYDVDAVSFIGYGGVFRQDRDAALALEIVRVEHALLHDLVGAEHAALAEQTVHERGLAVVDMRDDGDVAGSFVHICLVPSPS